MFITPNSESCIDREKKYQNRLKSLRSHKCFSFSAEINYIKKKSLMNNNTYLWSAFSSDQYTKENKCHDRGCNCSNRVQSNYSTALRFIKLSRAGLSSLRNFYFFSHIARQRVYSWLWNVLEIEYREAFSDQFDDE